MLPRQDNRGERQRADALCRGLVGLEFGTGENMEPEKTDAVQKVLDHHSHTIPSPSFMQA